MNEKEIDVREEVKKDKREKMSPKEKRNTIIIALVGSLIAIGTIVTPLIGQFSNKISSKKANNPSISWDSQKAGVYDEKRLFKTNENVFTIEKSNDTYFVSSIVLPEDAYYLVMPSAIKDANGKINSLEKVEKKTEASNIFNSTNISIKGLYFPSLYQNIGQSVFANLPSLEEIKFGSGKGSQIIGENAFENNSSLKSVTFSKNLVTISKDAFKNDSSIEKIDLLDTAIKNLGESAFEGCLSLKEFYLPSTISSLPKNIFAYCSSLTELNYEGSMAGWNNLSKDASWSNASSINKVICKDGSIDI